jgi:signal transduction histidine kinase
LSELIKEVEGLFIADGKNITITKDFSIKDETLYTDREKLRHILINILQNAIDSIGDKGTIEIKVSGNDENINISIKDSGKGMDEETIKNALKPFFTTKTKGTGLGLAIVENLLKVLHGTLKIESGLNRGTTVMISLQRGLK